MTPRISLLVPNADQIRALWEKFDTNRNLFDDALPADPFAFFAWIATSDSQTFLLGDPVSPDGAFIFSGIQPGEGAACHVFIWGRDKYEPKDLIAAARVTLGAVFAAHNLRRAFGVTPVTNLPARVFGERVGFKYLQGRLRQAVLIGGQPTDCWIGDIVKAEVDAALVESRDSIA